VLRRTVSAVLVLFAASILVFILASVASDPLGPLKQAEPPTPKSVIDAEAARLGLNLPLPTRYLHWIWGVMHGDWGPSVNQTVDIGQQLATRIPVSVELAGIALVIATVCALVVGTVAAIKPFGLFDSITTPLGFLLLALPSFWLAVILKQGGILFNNWTGTHTFYTIGSSSVNIPPGFGPHLANLLGHLVLPTATLVLVHFAAWSRYHRAAMLDALSSDFVKSAVVRGLSYPRVLWHGIRAGIFPLMTVVGMDIPALLSGTVIVEIVFQWNGMGALLVQSIQTSDTNAIMAWFMVAATAVVASNLLVDLAYGWMDPRARGAHSDAVAA
jgi:peptide/nickel transport system permease protein